MSNKNLTKTLFADFRKVDTKKLNINGNPFSKVVTDHVPETPTDNDIWKYAVTTDDNGVVTVTDDVAVDYSEITDAQKNIIKTAVKVIDNKVLDANDTLLMNWDTKNFTNENGSDMYSIFDISSTLTEWNSDLSSLENGNNMFSYSTLESFNGDLSSLTNGNNMFYGCNPLTSFNNDLSSLTNGINMFAYSDIQSFNGDLSSLTDAYQMFYKSALESFGGDLSSLENGGWMFYQSDLASFDEDLPSLVDGKWMFYSSSLASFVSDLPNLTDGHKMFAYNPIESFNCDLSNLTDGSGMFYNTGLTSFNGDLSSLANGNWMFAYTHERTYNIDHYKMVNGTKTQVTETFESNGLKSFISNLSSLKSGYCMFSESSISCSPLDEESIMLIADTINDISNNSDWTYTTYDYNGNLTTETISSTYQGKLHLGYDSSISDKTNIFKYCDEIVAKGWTVYLNGSQYTSTDSGSVALIDDESTSTPIPHYYKPVQVTDEEVAEYVDGNGNLFIIVGAQHVFGDDISSYGMFTSYDDAVTQITSSLGLTPYVKPTEETTEE